MNNPSRKINFPHQCHKPLGSSLITGDREELPTWLVDGILEMDVVIKAYYERQGVGALYEKQSAALEVLEASVDAGRRGKEWLLNDPDFTTLHAIRAFKR